MKKILLSLALALSLTACSKEQAAFTSGTYTVIGGDLLTIGTVVTIEGNNIIIADLGYGYSRADFYMITDAFTGCNSAKIAQWKERMLITNCNGLESILQKL